MKLDFIRRPLILVFLIVSIVIADQLSKNLAGGFLPTFCNEGIAFGIKLGGLGFLPPVIVVLFAGYFLLARSAYLSKFGFALVFAGGISNLIDRFFKGCVLDFIDFGFWPAFNLADASICIGVGVLLVFMIFDWKGSR